LKPKASPSPAKKKKEVPPHMIYIYEIYGKAGEETFLLSADFGNAYPIKDSLFNNSFFPTKFWTAVDRKAKFDKKGMVMKPKHFAEAYPLWIANGIAEEEEELRLNSSQIRQLVDGIKTEFQGKEIFFNGSDKKISFSTQTVMAGPVIEEGLLALSDLLEEPPDESDDVVDDAIPFE
jgi:hypothetical protein